MLQYQSELPRPIPRNSEESDHGCVSRIYFENAGDNVTLTLYKVTLTLYNMTLMSQKPRLGEKFHPGIYQWNLPVFTGMANKAQVANTGK